MSGGEVWVWDLPILKEQGESVVCVLVPVGWVVLGVSGWAAWARVWESDVKSVFDVSLDSLC